GHKIIIPRQPIGNLAAEKAVPPESRINPVSKARERIVPRTDQHLAKAQVISACAIPIILPPGETRPGVPVADEWPPKMFPNADIMPATDERSHGKSQCGELEHTPKLG